MYLPDEEFAGSVADIFKVALHKLFRYILYLNFQKISSSIPAAANSNATTDLRLLIFLDKSFFRNNKSLQLNMGENLAIHHNDRYWGPRFTEIQDLLRKHQASPQKATQDLTRAGLAGSFDHTLLKPEATASQIQILCEQALEYNLATVCVREPFVAQAAGILKGSGVRTCCVVGFYDPATMTLHEKLSEAQSAVKSGATELDMVINWPLLKGEEFDRVFTELQAMRDSCPKGDIVLKGILETSQLSRDDIVHACVILSEADFDYVKTSTGFVGGGAKVEDVHLMRRICALESRGMAVKASGGIRTLKQAEAMLQAGADRLGASASVEILQEFLTTTSVDP